MNETFIVNKALEQLGATTEIYGKWKLHDKDIDGEIDLHLGNNTIHLFAEVKKELREYQVQKLLEMADRYRPFMVIAERIFPTLKKKLRDKGINYLDTAGNIYVNEGRNFIWLDGNKHTAEDKPVTNRAFTKAGLKAVFYLLLHEEAINMPYRKIADAAGVALGNVKNVIEGLKDAGFILRLNDKVMKLNNKKELLHRWIAGYRETLKPALHIGSFRFLKDGQQQKWPTLAVEAGVTVWGGEPAAEHLTGYLAPQVLTIYTNEPKGNIMVKWRLVPDEEGNVRLFSKFWKDEAKDTERFAPPLLVYADLLLTDDPRCREAAELIFDQYLKYAFE